MKHCFFLSLFFLINFCNGGSVIKFENPRELIPVIKKHLPVNSVILSAGAYDGSEEVFLAQNFGPRSKIYAFEPVPELYNVAQAATRKYPNIFLYDLALADSCEMKTIYLSNLGNNPKVTASSSLLEPKEHLIYSPGTYFNNQIEVKCTTIDQWATDNKIQKIDFLWLDLQGFELNVMKASPDILKNVRVVLTEVEYVEAYKGQALYPEIKEWLENQGFMLIALSNVRGWFGDALFVRK